MKNRWHSAPEIALKVCFKYCLYQFSHVYLPWQDTDYYPINSIPVTQADNHIELSIIRPEYECVLVMKAVVSTYKFLTIFTVVASETRRT